MFFRLAKNLELIILSKIFSSDSKLKSLTKKFVNLLVS